jgi:tRNA pseudouridine55 synthase
VPLKPLQVEIKQLEILSVQADRVSFRARVASGTYLRSVAHDMGQRLGCGAHLESLRRTAVAEFKIDDAQTLDHLAQAFAGADSEQSAACFVHPRTLLPDIPSVTIDEVTASRIWRGQTVNLPDVSRARQVKVFWGQRELIAIATRVAGTLFHAKIVLALRSAESPAGRSTPKVHQRTEAY